MKIVNRTLMVLIGLLSIAAGAAKVMRVPQELEFLQGVGLDTTQILLFGVIQLIGGLLLIIPKMRVIAASLIFLGFAASSVLIFISGDLRFTLISLIPVVLAMIIFHQERALKNVKKTA